MNCRISKAGKNFDDASETCSTVGGKLPGPKTKAINDEIATEAINVLGSGNGYWLGINDAAKEGTWVYNSDGQEISWSNWRSGEPNEGSSRNCAMSLGNNSPTYHGLWWDYICTWKRYFICEF